MEGEKAPSPLHARKGVQKTPGFLSFLLDPRSWLAAGAAASLYLFLSAVNAGVDRTILRTTRFSDAQASLQKIDDLLLLNTLSIGVFAPFSWSSYRNGLLIQASTDLSAMEADRAALDAGRRRVLDRLVGTFARFRKEILEDAQISAIQETARRLVLLGTELSSWTAFRRDALFRRAKELEFARGIVLFSCLILLGGFLFVKARFQKTLSRQNRFYRALTRIDRLILSLPDLEILLSETCRIAVEDGVLRLACVLQYDRNTGTGRPLAWSGKPEGAEEFCRSTASEDLALREGRSLWEETVRARAPVVWNNIGEHLAEGPLQEGYAKMGILSAAGFPVYRGGELFGALLVHSGETGFFDPGLVDLLVVLSRNITFAIDNRDRDEARKEREEEVTHSSLFDPLTDLPNRRLFRDRVEQALERRNRKGEGFGVGILDLDGFKQVNDLLGHLAGDELLSASARRLRESLRGTDTLARLGGDEFGILFAGLDGGEPAALFDRVVASLSTPFDLGGRSVVIGGSLGVTLVPPDEGDGESLLSHADIAMYRVKERGKNGWELFRPAMAEALEERLRLREDLSAALREKQFVLHYQPQVDLSSGRLVGFEALLRWNHPARGRLDAGDFISALEEGDLAVEAGRWVLEEVFARISEWTRIGILPRVRINVGIRHLLSGSFSGDLRRAFLGHPEVLPQFVELDIVEPGSSRNIGRVKEVFDACRGIGVSVSIGNTGTENSSLSHLQTLGVDRVTIDRRFVRGLRDSPKDMAIVASLVTTAQLLLVESVGEGIETEEEGCLLLQWGCRIGQGYAIAPPMPPEEIPEWVGSYRPFPSWTDWKGHPWSPEDYPLIMAREAARVFMKNFLKGLETPGEMRPEWTNSHRCLQGRWIDGNGAMRYGNTLEFREYHELHEHLHALVREALVARDSGDSESLEKLKRSIGETNSKLVRRLEEFHS